MLTKLNLITSFKFFITSILFFSTIIASEVFAGAGTLIMVQNTSGTFVLLERDKKRDYFEFPGGTTEIAQSLASQNKYKESDYETALRETVEETRGYLGRRELMATSDPVKWRIEVDGFVIFRVITKMFDLDDILSIKIPARENGHWTPMLEIIDYAWVDINLILHSKSSKVVDTKGREIKIRGNLPEYIEVAKKKGWFL